MAQILNPAIRPEKDKGEALLHNQTQHTKRGKKREQGLRWRRIFLAGVSQPQFLTFDGKQCDTIDAGPTRSD